MPENNQEPMYETWDVRGETVAIEDIISSSTYAESVRSEIPEQERYEVRGAAQRERRFSNYNQAVKWVQENFDLEDKIMNQELSAASD